jgi:prophage maintenance system killer protein
MVVMYVFLAINGYRLDTPDVEARQVKEGKPDRSA